MDLFATDKAGLTNFQSVPVHYNGFVERWKQFNPDRSFFDHVKVLRPFPVDGYDFHAIGTVDDEKMSRILDLYDWLYSSEGTIRFGVEGQDYRMDGADIVPLKTDADGNMQVASDLYPIMSGAAGFSYLANWPEDAVQYVNPKIPAAVREPPSPRSSGFTRSAARTRRRSRRAGHRRSREAEPDHRRRGLLGPVHHR